MPTLRTRYIPTGEYDDYGCEIEREERYIAGARVWINIYDEDRAYGGPEEGGWWYNVGRSVRSIRVPRAHVQRVYERVKDACERANAGMPGLGSVACQGWFTVRIERGPGRDFPERRPYYE